MNRRDALKLLSAFAVAGCGGPEPDAKGLRVVVAGAGIIGASIAYHLTKSGASVTVVDKVGPATNGSRGTFAWINATWAKQPRAYHALNKASLEHWKVLQSELEIPIRWNGSIEWFSSRQRQERLIEQIAEQVQWGEPARIVESKELATLEPNVDFGAAEFAAFSESDGALDPVLAINALLRAAEDAGAEVKFPCEMIDASFSAGRLREVNTSLGPIAADALVLATGGEPDIVQRVAAVDVPQRSTPGVIAITEPRRHLLNTIVVAPGIHMHQREDGRIVLGEQDGAPQDENHALRLKGRPIEFPSQIFADQHAQRMVDVGRRFLPELADTAIDQVFIGWRPLPIDGHPVLGFSPNKPDVYIAIMHSGVTLAPIAGRFVAHELAGNAVLDQLEQYRPTRDFELVRRY